MVLAAERYASAFLISTGITFSLFWLMTLLIRVDGEPLPELPLPVVEIVDVIRERPHESIPRRQPVKPPLTKPPTTNLADSSEILSSQVGVPFPSHAPSDGVVARDRNLGLHRMDADASAIVRVPPKYPESARRRGIEGRVLVSYTVGRSGTVVEAHVIAAEPSHIFDAATLEAVRRWRFEPKIVDGESVEQRDLKISIPFRLDGENG